MKELDDFTVERLKEIETRARVSIALLKGDEVAALARIALAAKTAEPVAFRVGDRLFSSLYSAGCYSSEMKLKIEPLYLDAQPNSPELPDGWIKCSERMPEVGELVLIYTRHIEMIVASLDVDGFFATSEGTCYHPDSVVLWTPAPTPPTTEK